MYRSYFTGLEGKASVAAFQLALRAPYPAPVVVAAIPETPPAKSGAVVSNDSYQAGEGLFAWQFALLQIWVVELYVASSVVPFIELICPTSAGGFDWSPLCAPLF